MTSMQLHAARQQKKRIIAEAKGKFFGVTFTKKDGSTRKMTARRLVKKGLAGGEWANGNAGTAESHNLVLVTDMWRYNQGLDSRRSFNVDNILSLTVNGKTWKF